MFRIIEAAAKSGSICPSARKAWMQHTMSPASGPNVNSQQHSEANSRSLDDFVSEPGPKEPPGLVFQSVNLHLGYLDLDCKHLRTKRSTPLAYVDLASPDASVQRILQQVAARAQAWDDSALGIEARTLKERGIERSNRKVTLQEVHRILGTIVERPWFSRVWVIQEVALARHPSVLIGPFRLPWEELAKTEEYIHTNALFESALMRSNGAGSKVQQMDKIRDLVEKDSYVSLTRLMSCTSSSFCTDPRDRLYGILGLVKEAMLGKLPVDYGSSVLEVLGRGFENLLYENPSVLLLAQPQNSSLPSWYPDLTIHQNGNLWLHRPAMRGIDATNGSKESFIFDHGSGRLAVRGRIIDKVSSSSVKLQLRPQNGLGHGVFRGFERTYREQETAAIVVDAWAGFLRSKLLPAEMKNSNLLSVSYVTGENVQIALNKTLSAGARIVVDWWAEVLRNSVDRRFFITEKLYMGMGPMSVRKDDMIAIICGAVVPFVLRRKGRGYQVVGPCYVQGIMSGEALPSDATDLYDIVLC